MKEPKRYDCGNGEGMFDDKKGDWISYKEHNKILNKLKESLEQKKEQEFRKELQVLLDKYDAEITLEDIGLNYIKLYMR